MRQVGRAKPAKRTASPFRFRPGRALRRTGRVESVSGEHLHWGKSGGGAPTRECEGVYGFEIGNTGTEGKPTHRRYSCRKVVEAWQHYSTVSSGVVGAHQGVGSCCLSERSQRRTAVSPWSAVTARLGAMSFGSTMMRTQTLEDRGVGRTAKNVVVELHPPNELHLAASGHFNRETEAWEKLAEKLTLGEASTSDENATAPTLVTPDDLETRSLPHQWTVLMCAARHGSVEDLEQLIEAGADVNVTDVYRSTPLHAAARCGSAAKIEALCHAGAHLEARDRYGHSPLHVACACDQPEAVRVLVLAGADVYAKDGPLLDGDTPYQVAQSFGFTKACEVLKATERRRYKLAGGNTQLVPADSVLLKISPTAFSPKRMNTKPISEPRWGLIASDKLGQV